MTIPYPDPSTLPADLRDVLANKPHNVYRMIMHTPDLARGYLAMAQSTLRESALPDPLRELVILRVGHRYQAPYELFHHEKMARAAGLSEAAISAAGVGWSDEEISAEERRMLAWTDALLANHKLAGQDRDDAVEALGYKGLADLVMTVGFYQLVCNFLLTFEVPIES